jgi:hypothetical protein
MRDYLFRTISFEFNVYLIAFKCTDYVKYGGVSSRLKITRTEA